MSSDDSEAPQEEPSESGGDSQKDGTQVETEPAEPNRAVLESLEVLPGSIAEGSDTGLEVELPSEMRSDDGLDMGGEREGEEGEEQEEDEDGEDTDKDEDGAERKDGEGKGDEDDEEGESEGTAGPARRRRRKSGLKDTYSQKSVLEPLAIKTLEQLAQVYVRPELHHLNQTLEAFQSCHVLVVHGLEHAGKLATSVAIAARLLSGSGEVPLIYRRKSHEANSLLEVVQSKDWVGQSVVILEDALEKGVALNELAVVELDQLSEALRNEESFLIVTTELALKALNVVAAPSVFVQASKLPEILASHIRFYGGVEHEKFTKQLNELSLCEGLCEILKTPFHIDRFCSKLQEIENKGRSEIETLAQAIAQIGLRAVRSWFERLTSNEKLVAMLVYLFEGLDARSLEDLTMQVVFRFRSEGFLWPQDPRRIGFKSLLETIRARCEEEEIEFEDNTVKEEVAWQCGNRQALLWSALDPVVSETNTNRMWLNRGRRAALGAAVGRLGITDSERFLAHLDFWARSRGSLPRERRDGIAALAGSAMAESLRKEPETQVRLLLQKLRKWVDSKDPDLMWTAGAAIWRIYPLALRRGRPLEMDDLARSMRSQLKRLLRDLVCGSGDLSVETRKRVSEEVRRSKRSEEDVRRVVGKRLYDIGEEVRDCSVYAIDRIGRDNIFEMVALLLDWMSERDLEHLRRVAFKTARKALIAAGKLNIEPIPAKYLPLLKLIGGIIANTSGTSPVSRSLCSFLAAWLQWDSWREKIGLALLDVANRGTCHTRASLREALSHHWLQGAASEAEGLAQAVIARSYAMDGILTDRPILGRCVVVVDQELFEVRAPSVGKETEAERETARRKGALQQVLAAIEVHMEVSVVLLGDGPGAPGETEGAKWRLTSGAPIQRLMMPGFQRFAAEGARMVLVVTSGPVLDLEDALGSIAADTKIVVAAGCELDPPLGVELLPVGRTFSAKDVETVEKRLQDLWAETLVKIAPNMWLPLLEEQGVYTEHLESFDDSLEAWAGRLGELDSATGRTDLAKKILCVLFWLAASDFKACLRIVRRWLTEGEETGLRRNMGAAAGFALFRAATDAPTAWGELTSIRLFDELAGPLGGFGQDGIDAVLRAVERWLAEPDLAAGLAGAVEDGRGRLLRWAEELAPQKLESFQAALDHLRSAVEKEKEELGRVGEALDSILERLRVRLAMGRPRPLPILEDGERYGVIVLDAAARSSGGGARWAQLASALFARFNREAGGGLKPVLYRLGERWPAWVAGDRNPAAVDLSFDGFQLPRLLGPILTSGLSPGQVDFMVIFADEVWIDGEDWIDTPWRERIVTYRQLQDAPWGAAFSTLPNLQEKDEVDRLSRYLRQQFTGREEHRHEY